MTAPLIVEAIAQFSLGVFVVGLRLFSRWKLVGLKKWGGDDYFSLAAAVFWTVSAQLLYGSGVGWTPTERASFDEATIRRLETGSQLVLVGWFGYIATLWALKASMLFFYDRITMGLVEQKIVRGCAVYCAASFLAVNLALVFNCRPFHKKWQVYPDPGRECTTHYSLYPVVAVLNIISDLVLVWIPIPILVRLQAKKLMIGALLCSGIFIIVAALLRCSLALSNINKINVAAIWAVRETFVAIIVVNAPAIKPLFNMSTWTNRSKAAGSSNDNYALSSTSKSRTARKTHTVSGHHNDGTYMFADSDEAIVPRTFECEILGETGEPVKEGIQVTTEYETRYEPA
ncbi:hypothetical protein BDV12DRAFT_187336 [Aspergillus spectabilis]